MQIYYPYNDIVRQTTPQQPLTGPGGVFPTGQQAGTAITGPELPATVPLTAGQAPAQPVSGGPLVSPLVIQQPQTPVMGTAYTQGYLTAHIGSMVRVQFLIGENMLTDRTGTLAYVGIDYIVIKEVETDDLLLCDLYSIKFVTFFR